MSRASGISSTRVLLLLLAGATLGVTIMLTLIAMSDRPADDILRGGAEKPDPMLAVPDFTLIDQNGEPFGTEQLSGKVWIVDFIFTRCGGTCPRMTLGMAELQKILAEHPKRDQIRLVSITVDPNYDTPWVLTNYASRYGADPQRWRFLTGDRDKIWRLVGEGFREAVFDNIDNPAMPIGHSSNFILVDREQRIRGYFAGIDMMMPDGSTQGHERVALLRRLDEVIGE